MLRRSRPRWMQWLIGVLLIVLFVALVWSNYQFSQQSPGGNDFLARWTGAHYWLIEGMNPYDDQVSLEAQRMIYGRPADPSQGEDIAHFVYPFPAMLFFAPFGLLPYPTARALWMTILEVCLPILAFLGLRISRWKPGAPTTILLILYSIFWYHGLRSVIVGQFAVIEAVLIVGGLWLIQREADTLAGILFGLTIAKPQMAFLILPYILIWVIRNKRYQILTSFLITLISLITISLLVLPDWPLLWLRQLVSYPSYTDLGSPVSILVSWFPADVTIIEWGLTGVLVAYLLLEWILSLNQDEVAFQWTAALTLVVTNLIAFRTATTNFVVLLPGLFFIFSSWAKRWGRGGLAAVWVTSLGLMIGLWVLFLSTVDGNIEAPIMYLPLPLLVLLGLVWSRWWILNTRRYPATPL